MRSGVHSLLSKPERTRFQKLIKSLNVMTKARPELFGEEETPGTELPDGQHSKGLWD